MKTRLRWLAAAVLAGALAVGLRWGVGREGGRPSSTPADGCAGCHAEVGGLEPSHQQVGCAACHLGDRAAREASLAHAGLVRLPGNADDLQRTCGAAGCHPAMPARLENNIMTTMNGVVSVDRWVFGEQPTPTARTPVTDLGTSRADTHLRNLCASCHLSAAKREPGPITEQSRGGGCNACHLRYSDQALQALAQWPATKKLPVHPQLRARPTKLHCFGCHSRSGRVSLNYDGWAEAKTGTRTLEDGRTLEKHAADVHSTAGMDCVDCHGSWEVMGTGAYAMHREDQQTVQCGDCHARAPLAKRLADADDEARRITRLAAPPGSAPDEERELVVLARSGLVLAGTRVTDGGVVLERTGRRAAAPADACSAPAHRALTCPACHDAWAPQCVGCHTRFDPNGTMFDLLDRREREGQWHEVPGDTFVEPPTLGVREEGGERRVEEFSPGMIATIDGRFRRLFAPTFPHTVQRAARPCASCHANPLALGYGRGRLEYQGRAWRFSPARPRLADGLPDDAWLGFLTEPDAGTTTRENTRPFSLAEQRRILAVGACLTCHAPDSRPLKAALAGEPQKPSHRCATPR